MIPKKNVTEEDLKATEAMLASSFKNMKSSLTRIPGDMVKPVTNIVKAHPYATVVAAAGAGLIGYQLIRLMTPRVVTREVRVGPKGEVTEHKRSSLASQIVAFAAPYIVSYIQQEVTRFLSRPIEERPVVKTSPEK
ncbi:MAG TPA: hypothetical protein VGK13_01165 [Methanocellaceae archaeon]|jgi:hypothetical protein